MLNEKPASDEAIIFVYKFFIIILFLSTTSFSQGNYVDAPFGGGGGYTPAWYIPNLDPVNDRAKAFGIPELSTSGFYTSGGAGLIYLGFVPGLRIGGMGYGGSTSESAIINGYNKEVIYSLGGGGLTVEYTLPFIKNIGVSVGAVIGGGSLEIEIYKTKNLYHWNELWLWEDRRVPTEDNEVTNTIENNFWFFSPTLNVDIPIYRFVSFRVGAGYQFAFGDSWSANNGDELINVPSELNANSFFIQSGIFIGFFSF